MGTKRQDFVDELRNLADSAREVIENWSIGDLARAVNGLEEALESADHQLAEWDRDD